MLNESLTTAAARCLDTGNEHRGQFVRLADKRLALLSVEVSAIDRQTEPKMALVSFFERDLELREEFRLRAAPSRGSIVRSHTAGATRQLIRNRPGSWPHRHSIRDSQAFERESTGANQKLTHVMLHGRCKADTQRRNLAWFYVLSSNL